MSYWIDNSPLIGDNLAMCRSIKQLRPSEKTAVPILPPTQEEIQAAALQYVRKVSGYRKPSRANQESFAAAVEEITAATQRLLDSLF